MVDEENHEVDIQGRRLSIQKGRLNDACKSINDTARWSYRLIPKEVGDLLLLQYLILRSTKVKSIPKTIGKLAKLLTLDLKRCPVCKLPFEIGNLRKLRHLIVYQNTWHNTFKHWQVGAVTVLEGALGRPENLQKLADVNIATNTDFMDQLATIRMLKYLVISNVRRDNSWTLCKAIEKLTCLKSLNIRVDYDNNDPLDLKDVTCLPLQLQRLYLIGPLDELPEWIGRLENLKKLRFRGSKLKEIPFHILRDLLINLNTFEIQPGALPCIETLTFHRSPQLKEVHVGLQYLERYSLFNIVEMPVEFIGSISLQPDIVKHVADIRVGYQTSSARYIFRKL